MGVLGVIEGDDVPSAQPVESAKGDDPDGSTPPREDADNGRLPTTGDVLPTAGVKVGDPVGRTPEEKAAADPRHTHRRRRRAVGSWSMLGAGALILLIGGWVGWRGYQAYSHLETASADVATLQDQLTDVTNTDPAAAAATVNHLQTEAAAAGSAVNDPIFRAATVLPFVGGNLDAIREITLTVDSLATEVMPPLVDIAQTLRPADLAPHGGAINLESIQHISPELQKVDAAVNQAREEMAAIDRSAVVGPVGDAVLTLLRKLDQAAKVSGTGARVARLVPPMLGSEGPRTYLVVFQNSAEPRATGGIFGSFAVIKADHGKITIVDQGSARSLGTFKQPVAQLRENEIELYTGEMAQYPADVNLTPDFPTAAPLFAEMYRLRTGNTVDGVLAIDPVALSYLLNGAAPIDVGEGVSVTSDNLVPILLSTAYAKFDKRDQSQRDDFLAKATARVFSQVMSGRGDARLLLAGLRRAADERRVLIYSADPSEQADIATTGVSGAIDTDLGAPSIGVFLNDGTAAKLGYYLSNEVHVTPGECQSDGRRELLVKVLMHNRSPSAGLPAYVVGPPVQGKAYLLRTNVLLFAPTGGGIVKSATRDGVPIPIGRGEDHARQVGATTVDLTPGATTELTFTILGPVNVDGVVDDVLPQLELTPGVTPWVTSVDPYRDCHAFTD